MRDRTPTNARTCVDSLASKRARFYRNRKLMMECLKAWTLLETRPCGGWTTDWEDSCGAIDERCGKQELPFERNKMYEWGLRRVTHR